MGSGLLLLIAGWLNVNFHSLRSSQTYRNKRLSRLDHNRRTSLFFGLSVYWWTCMHVCIYRCWQRVGPLLVILLQTWDLFHLNNMKESVKGSFSPFQCLPFFGKIFFFLKDITALHSFSRLDFLTLFLKFEFLISCKCRKRFIIRMIT